MTLYTKREGEACFLLEGLSATQPTVCLVQLSQLSLGSPSPFLIPLSCLTHVINSIFAICSTPRAPNLAASIRLLHLHRHHRPRTETHCRPPHRCRSSLSLIKPNLPFSSTRTCGANVYNLGGGQLISTTVSLPTPVALVLLPSHQCPPFAILTLAAARPRRRLYQRRRPYSSELAMPVKAVKSSAPYPPRSLMLRNSKRFFKVNSPSQFLIPPTYTTPSRFLDHWGYTDITVITDEDGVEERLRPTAANLVPLFLQSYPRSMCPDTPSL